MVKWVEVSFATVVKTDFYTKYGNINTQKDVLSPLRYRDVTAFYQILTYIPVTLTHACD